MPRTYRTPTCPTDRAYRPQGNQRAPIDRPSRRRPPAPPPSRHFNRFRVSDSPHPAPPINPHPPTLQSVYSLSDAPIPPPPQATCLPVLAATPPGPSDNPKLCRAAPHRAPADIADLEHRDEPSHPTLSRCRADRPDLPAHGSDTQTSPTATHPPIASTPRACPLRQAPPSRPHADPPGTDSPPRTNRSQRLPLCRARRLAIATFSARQALPTASPARQVLPAACTDGPSPTIPSIASAIPLRLPQPYLRGPKRQPTTQPDACRTTVPRFPVLLVPADVAALPIAHLPTILSVTGLPARPPAQARRPPTDTPARVRSRPPTRFVPPPARPVDYPLRTFPPPAI